MFLDDLPLIQVVECYSRGAEAFPRARNFRQFIYSQNVQWKEIVIQIVGNESEPSAICDHYSSNSMVWRYKDTSEWQCVYITNKVAPYEPKSDEENIKSKSTAKYLDELKQLIIPQGSRTWLFFMGVIICHNTMPFGVC
ncbi:MAG: hypothetical protein CMB24_06225 [Euryarchaeota archaeon]|nr:hypothetical protein [Euryarchaeota archaeon]